MRDLASLALRVHPSSASPRSPHVSIQIIVRMHHCGRIVRMPIATAALLARHFRLRLAIAVRELQQTAAHQHRWRLAIVQHRVRPLQIGALLLIAAIVVDISLVGVRDHRQRFHFGDARVHRCCAGCRADLRLLHGRRRRHRRVKQERMMMQRRRSLAVRRRKAAGHQQIGGRLRLLMMMRRWRRRGR